MVELTIAVWAHRWSDFFPKVIGSIGRYVRSSYELVVVAEPGNCHENMQRAIDRAHGRFLWFFDEDVELLDEHTPERMLQVASMPDIGIVAPIQIYDRAQAEVWRDCAAAKGLPRGVVADTPWCGAYAMMVDREKIPDLYADQKIPWIKAMTDVDICQQAHAKGLKVVIDGRSAVYHEDKGRWSLDRFEAYQCPPNDGSYMKKWQPLQLAYMRGKWGEGFKFRKPRADAVRKVEAW